MLYSTWLGDGYNTENISAAGIFTPESDGIMFCFDTIDDLFYGRFEAFYCKKEISVPLVGKNLDNYYFVGFDFHHKEIDLPYGFSFGYPEHAVGSVVANTYRLVYPLNLKGIMPVRAGLTTHPGNGSWSSFPPHKFEIEALTTPRNDNFSEIFSYVTKPQMGWGVQVINKEAKIIHDRDVQLIPLSSHPVIAGPGFRLAYFWCYYAKNIDLAEKFTDQGRI